MDLSMLNARQRDAVETTEGPLLVLAGAGSGKTRVITHRVAQLLERGVAPPAIVAITFTNKAAGEMRDRLRSMVGKSRADELTMGTFHSLGVRMLRADPKAFGISGKRFSILDQGDVFGLVRGLLREHGHHGHGGDRRFDIGGVVQRISLWKNEFVSPEQAAAQGELDEYAQTAASVYPDYEDRLRSLGAVDFDDLVCLIAKGLRDDESTRRRWQKKFRYVLVDEYQDTNDAQFEMLRQMVGPPFNLCVVGDDDQAIYGWRGAKVTNILAFDTRYPTAKVIRLEQNYRSTPPILHCANEVIEHNRDRLGKRLVPTRRGGGDVTVVVAGDGNQEANWVGKEVRKLVLEKRVPADEVAVLYRSALQGKAIEERLREHAVEYRVVGGQAFYDKKEVKDALAYLKVLVAPRDELAVRRALETPSRGIGGRTMEMLHAFAEARRVSLLDAVHRAAEVDGVPPRARQGLERFSSLIRAAQARGRAAQSMAAGLGHILQDIDLRGIVRKETGSDEATKHRWAGVQWLLDSVERYEGRMRAKGKRPRWHEYLGSTALQNNDNEETPTPGGKVTLCTLHSAKGLEWDHVFIIGVEEGTMPHRRVDAPRASDAIAGDLEEERRLFYVGITRARRSLWLTRGANRIERGKEVPRIPSRFLEELPEKGVRVYEIANEEELSSDAIGSMADAFLARIRPVDEEAGDDAAEGKV